MPSKGFVALVPFLLTAVSARHFSLEARQENIDGSTPIYKDPEASVEDRVKDLLPRMTLEEKVSQLIQGDINGWTVNIYDPLDNTLAFNQSGLENMLNTKAGSIWAGYQLPWEKLAYTINIGQRYLMENTTLGIPALFQSEGLHGFTNNGTIWPSPIGLANSFNVELMHQAAETIAAEAEGLGINHLFAPVLDLGRELRWGRVEEGFGEDPYLTGEMALAYVEGVQAGRRRNTSDTAIAKIAATCKHFAGFGTPQGGLNLGPVAGGERELRMTYLRPFHRACLQSLSIMTAYHSYDGVPGVADKHMLTDILRGEWGYKYWAVTDAGAVDRLINNHKVCATRECAAKLTLENGLQGEMGGGTYTYLTLPDQVRAGTVDEKYIDDTVTYLLRTKFSLGLFENPYAYEDYESTLRQPETMELLHQMDQESIVVLENHNGTLPLSKDIGSIALIGPQVDRVTFGDYVFFNATNNAVSPLDGFTDLLSNTSVEINFAQGAQLWSNSDEGFDEALAAVEASDVAIVMVGTWSLDQTLLWQDGQNATTGEMRDQHDLGLVGAQKDLVHVVGERAKELGKPFVVVFVSGKGISEPWIKDNADAVIQQFYPGELGGLALAEIIFGDANPSGKLSLSVPRDVGTAPAFYDYQNDGRNFQVGSIGPNGEMNFGRQYVLEDPTPLWSFGRGLSYTTFEYSDLTLSSPTIGTSDDFTVTVTVQNTGSRAGKEVIQVYLSHVMSSVVTPNQQLVGFSKVLLEPEESKEVAIEITNEQLAIWGLSREWVVEPGQFAIKIGTSEEVFLNTTLTVE
ncbi:glycoside hydrolase family 3 protein [Pterulicium gracile]|uniref:Glycoside hydrolase family 3 protein n=1 Tax=Pterulicium gracile TaxID=1884261 RepID=A0A5C3Q9A2_9AGAR|nr:glycoside hydrolase family 3 protein [Pterula gracilis]